MDRFEQLHAYIVERYENVQRTIEAIDAAQLRRFDKTTDDVRKGKVRDLSTLYDIKQRADRLAVWPAR